MTEPCGVCGGTDDHTKKNHEYSLTGQLIPKKNTSPTPPVRYIKTADTELRALLIGKGIITSDELKLLPEREGS